jgi:Domain of unknown function (DUF4586)
MATKEDLNLSRQKFFDDSSFDPTNQKYGLFSFSGTLAVNKQPYFQSTPVHKDSDGKVPTGPHNFLVPGAKSGKTNEAYFSAFEYQPDKYHDPVRATKSEKDRTERLKKVHESVWKPAAKVNEPVSLFPHQPSDVYVKINRKLPEGGVRLDPKNYLTSPAKKGNAAVTPGILLGPAYEHLNDEYDRKVKTAREEAKASRMKRHGGPFCSMDYGNKTFNEDKTLYGGSFTPKANKRPRAISTAKHDKPFYPSNPGKKNKTIGPYPEHMHDPFLPKAKKQVSEAPAWKTTTVERTKPAPSIVFNFKNIRNDFPGLRNLT